MPADPLSDLSLNPYAAPTGPGDPASSTSPDLGDILRAEEVRKRFLKHEATIRSIGTLFYFTAAIAVLAAIDGAVGLARAVDPARENEPRAWVDPAIALVVSSGFSALFLAVGLGLRRLRSWARLLALFAVSLGVLTSAGGILKGFQADEPDWTIPQAVAALLVEAFILWALISPRAGFLFSRDYADVVAKTPHIEPRLGLWIRIFLVFFYPFLILGALSLLMRLLTDIVS